MVTEMTYRKRAWVLALIGLTCGCGGGGGAGDGSEGSASATATGDPGAADLDAPADVDAPGRPSMSGLPFVGTLILDEYDWIDLVVDYLGVIRVELPSGRVGRFLAGHDGAAHPINGSTVFIQACGGGGAGRVAMADERGSVTRLLTPCSSEVPNPSDYSSTYWEKPVLSFDGTRVAVEGHYLIGGGSQFFVAVYDMDTNQLGQSPGWAPAWTPDGRLVFGSADGLYLADAALVDPVRVDDGQLIGAVYGPKVHPAGDRVLFEYNQRIWQIGLDGSDLEEVAFGSARFSSPAYSPDGTAIAFIASESELDALLYLKNIAGDEYYPLDIRDQLSTSGVPGGPITWTSGLP